MRILGLLFGNWIVVNIFDGSFSSIMFCVLAGVADYIFIWYAIKYVKNKRYREIWSTKTKMISFSLNIVLTIFCSMILYDQYFSPECKVVTEKFDQCMLMRGEDFDMGKISVAISRNMKESMIQISDSVMWCITTVNDMKELNESDISESVKLEKVTAMKADMEQKKEEMAVHQQELKHTEILIAVLLLLNLIRLILWNYVDLVTSFKRLRVCLDKKRAAV